MTAFRRSVAAAAAAGAALSALALAPTAAAQSGVLVYPGMEIRQNATVCTLGFVDVAARIGYSAGHCRGEGPVTDRNGRVIGVVTNARDNTPDGAVVRTDQVIADYEMIKLNNSVTLSDFLPGGRQLIAASAAPLAAGHPVCHFGIMTGESCGSVERINNGWFTMANGVISQKGDSGGPVYALGADGRAVIVGLFNSTWGNLPAAVGWNETRQHLQEDMLAGGPGTDATDGNEVINVAATQTD
ncbi:MAG: hypothetical protein ACKOB8_12165 [Mycobacterium sp.]